MDFPSETLSGRSARFGLHRSLPFLPLPAKFKFANADQAFSFNGEAFEDGFLALQMTGSLCDVSCIEKGWLNPGAWDSVGGPHADSAHVGLENSTGASGFGSVGLGDGSQAVTLGHVMPVVVQACDPSGRPFAERGLLGAKESPTEDRVHCEETAG